MTSKFNKDDQVFSTVDPELCMMVQRVIPSGNTFNYECFWLDDSFNRIVGTFKESDLTLCKPDGFAVVFAPL